MVRGPDAVAPGPRVMGLHHPPATDWGTSVGRYPRKPPHEAGARGSRHRDRRPPSFDGTAATHPEHPSPGRSDGASPPFSSIYHLPVSSSYCQPRRNPVALTPAAPSDSGMWSCPSTGPGPTSTRVLLSCHNNAGSSSPATPTRLPSSSTGKTLPNLAAKIYPRHNTFSALQPGAPERPIMTPAPDAVAGTATARSRCRRRWRRPGRADRSRGRRRTAGCPGPRRRGTGSTTARRSGRAA